MVDLLSGSAQDQGELKRAGICASGHRTLRLCSIQPDLAVQSAGFSEPRLQGVVWSLEEVTELVE